MKKAEINRINGYIRLCALLYFTIFVLIDCDGKQLIHSNAPNVRMLSGKKLFSEAYTIPYESFRGVDWSCDYFDIWTVHHCFPRIMRDIHYKVIIKEKVKNISRVKETWNIEVVNSKDKVILYNISNNDKSKSLELELPIKKRKYDIAVLRDNSDNFHIICYMDLDETIIDKGLFGYIIIY